MNYNQLAIGIIKELESKGIDVNILMVHIKNYMYRNPKPKKPPKMVREDMYDKSVD